MEKWDLFDEKRKSLNRIHIRGNEIGNGDILSPVAKRLEPLRNKFEDFLFNF
ncbi:MAG: hypothetical protein ACQEQD_09125 [Bacillota bacterium]